MRLTITIDTDNASFKPDMDSMGTELARILRVLAVDVEYQLGEIFDHGRKLMDYNGNTVGHATFNR